MPHLRTSFLLRRPARVTGLPPAGRFVVLVGATSFFLWMFLAVAPIETLADTGTLRRTDGTDATLRAYEFAAQWRHGMAGNAPLYMPGFFLLAVSAWLWAGADVSARSIPRRLIEGAVALISGLAVAWIVSRTIGDGMVPGFEQAAGFPITVPWPIPSGRAISHGLCTAAAWTATVVACRRALARLSFRPLLVIPPITAALIMIRPWTVNDFVGLWVSRAAAGEGVALGSLLAVPICAWILAITERPPQWVQTHLRHCRIWRDV